MGLRDTIQKAAKAAVAATGDVAEKVTYNSLTSVTYAPATSATPTETQAPVSNVPIVWQDIETSRVDGRNVLIRDREVLVTAKDLGTVVPESEDEIERSNGEKWRVVRKRTDPAEAAYILQVRQ